MMQKFKALVKVLILKSKLENRRENNNTNGEGKMRSLIPGALQRLKMSAIPYMQRLLIADYQHKW
jgi:hypothetical protein